MRKDNIKIDFGIGVEWDITIEDHGEGFIMLTLEQYDNGKRTICTEQLFDEHTLKDLVNVIEKFI